MTRPEPDHLPTDPSARLEHFHATIHDLLDQVSHDFRTPLTVIKEFATLMGDGQLGAVSPRQREFLDVINDRADDLTLVVDNVLDAGKSGAGVLRAWRRATDAGEVVRTVEAPLARKTAIKGIGLDVAVEPGLPAVCADPEQLARVLLNLVAGVLKSFEEPRGVRVWASSEVEPGRVCLGVTVEGGRIGRKPLHAIAAALDPTRPCDAWNARGAAWRFALARRLADLHFGQIRLERSCKGQTTFRLSLPTAEPRCVLDAYLRHLALADGTPAGARLVAVSIGSEVPSAAAGVVDEFLQSSVDLADLVVQMAPCRWLLVLGALGMAGNVRERIESSWSEMRKRRHGRLLPRLALAGLGPWNPDGDVDTLVGRFAAEAVATSGVRRKPDAWAAEDAGMSLATAN
jgi:hypothetical protein